MKINQLIFIITVGIFVARCQSPSEQIKNAFSTVDRSLVISGRISQPSIDSLYAVVNQNRQKYNDLASKGDMIYTSYQEVYKLLDSLKLVLHRKDASGTHTLVATKLLMHSVTSDSLTSKLSRVYTDSWAILDPNERLSLDSSMGSVKEIRTAKDWTKQYFGNTPTIAAITILSKLQSECLNGTTIAMEDLTHRLLK